MNSFAAAGSIALTLPALFALGLASSPHCAVMCGPWLMLGKPTLRQHMELQLGRMLGYAIMGGIAGVAGGWLLSHLPAQNAIETARLLAAALLLGLAWHIWRMPPRRACCPGPLDRLHRQPAPLRGLLMGLMPCALLYATLGLAAFTGNAIEGAGLLLAFGLGSSPLLLLAGGLLSRIRRTLAPMVTQRVSAATLALSAIWIGGATLLPVQVIGWLCARAT